MSLRLPFINDMKQLYEKEIKNIPEEEALDSIIYGALCHRIKNGSSYKGMLSLSDKIPDHLCFSNQTENKINTIQLKNITNITFNQNNENLKNYTPKSEEEQFIQINMNQKTYDFSFKNKKRLNIFIKGLITLFDIDNLMGDRRKDVANYMEDNINSLFNKNNNNFDNILDENEFKNLAREIGIQSDELLLYIDQNRDGLITKDEVMNYFKNIISGTEFIDIFKKYSSIKNNCNDNKEYTMGPDELKNFFKEVQKEPINDLEAYQLIINFKSSLSNEAKKKMSRKFQNIYFYNKYQMNIEQINKALIKLNNRINNNEENLLNKNDILNNNNNNEIKLELNLKEFSNMLNSFLLTVYDKKKQMKELNTSHSLVDYYINSSHNTYLKGHQLKGLSDPKMYAFAVLKGFRLVELDCYNGQGDDIIITHGYTLVTKLKVEDILKELKENSFKNSPYPVILSIENHLDKKHQQILAERFKQYLVDLYIFPYDSPPKTIPTLEELKYKFIIKCGGKRLYEDVNIPLKEITENNENKRIKGKNSNNRIQKYILEENYEDVSDSDEDIESECIDEFPSSREEIIVDRELFLMKMKKKKNKYLNECKSDVLENILKNSIMKKNDYNDLNEEKGKQKQNGIKVEEETKNITKIENNENEEEKQNANLFTFENIKLNEENENQILRNIPKDIKEEEIEEENTEEIEKEENEYITSLENARGLLGQKFYLDRIETFKYKHWEFVTLKSTLYLRLYPDIEKRKKLIKLSSHCMMKAYPQKFDSSNYDIIKCWCCGCQTAAINIQAVEDDYTLFNQIFFTQNNNCGYVLKPKKFLSNTFQFEDYKNPKYYLKIKIINLFNLTKLIQIANISKSKNSKMQMKIYTLGPYIENDSNNSKKYKNEYIFELIGGLLTPSILDNKIIKIPVYEDNLGGIMIKFYYEKDVIGRGCIPFCLMKMGYRKIPIYDNDTIERESIFVIGYFEKVF